MSTLNIPCEGKSSKLKYYYIAKNKHIENIISKYGLEQYRNWITYGQTNGKKVIKFCIPEDKIDEFIYQIVDSIENNNFYENV